jgi:predicted RNA binding protein YcfA (HicA-like mRNA interferase family)
MSKREKLIDKICLKGQVSIDEIHALMEHLGFVSRQNGSHVTFTKGSVMITIPAKSQVKPCYLEQLCEILRGVGL